MQNNPQYDVITSGYVSMDRIIKLKTPARVGFTSLVENRTSADIRYGGCSVNISYDLCRLGIRSLPVMRVGDDYEQIGFKRAAFRSPPPRWCRGNAPPCATCFRTTRGSISPCFIPAPWTPGSRGRCPTAFLQGRGSA